MRVCMITAPRCHSLPATTCLSRSALHCNADCATNVCVYSALTNMLLRRMLLAFISSTGITVQVPDIVSADPLAAALLIECRGRDEAALKVGWT